MQVGWTAENENGCLKYQTINIGPDWEYDEMTVYTDLKACLLDGKGWSFIKAFDMQKYIQQATVNLSEHYEVDGEVNKLVAWVTSNIENCHFMSKHTYSFEKFLTLLQYYFTILNGNVESHSDNQMLIKMIEKIKVPNNSEMNAFRSIFLNTHGQNFVNAMAYLSGQVTET